MDKKKKATNIEIVYAIKKEVETMEVLIEQAKKIEELMQYKNQLIEEICNEIAKQNGQD